MTEIVEILNNYLQPEIVVSFCISMAKSLDNQFLHTDKLYVLSTDLFDRGYNAIIAIHRIVEERTRMIIIHL